MKNRHSEEKTPFARWTGYPRSILLAVGAFALLACMTPTRAQPVGLVSPLPAYIAEIRLAQAQLAAEGDVPIRFFDNSQRSLTRIEGVPAEFREEVIETEHDLFGLLEQLYAYYGFTGSENLQFERNSQVFSDMTYEFREYIDGIETDTLFIINVNLETKRISRLRDALHIDRDLPRRPTMSEQDAIDVALCFVERSDDFRLENYQSDGPHELEIVYKTWGTERGLTPMWRVRLASIDTRRRDDGETLSIAPDRTVLRSSFVSHGRDPNEAGLCAG